MEINFTVGDTVDVEQGAGPIRGEVARIYYDKTVPKPYPPKIVSVKRPSGSHNEYTADPDTGFDFITKVED